MHVDLLPYVDCIRLRRMTETLEEIIFPLAQPEQCLSQCIVDVSVVTPCINCLLGWINRYFDAKSMSLLVVRFKLFNDSRI